MKDKPVILVVDDQPQNIELLEAYLVPQGYEIVKAANGEEALARVVLEPPDLILLDVVMPKMTGFEVLRKLRADEKTRLIPIVMITALRETADRIKAIEAGCDDFISKPFDRHELLARVKSLLRVKSLHDEIDAAREYAESIINTVREPLIALDHNLRIVTASRSFYKVFKVKPEETVGQLIYDLGNKQWDIPKLRELLETILPQKATFDGYEVEHDFTTIGRRVMLLNARQIQRVWGKERIILLAIEDITEQKRLEDLLTESEERYRRLFETASDGIVLLEKLEGKITHANPATEKMLGYTKEESTGNKLQDIGVSLDMGDFQTTMQTLNKTGIINYNGVPAITKSGQHIDTDIYLVDRARLVQCNIRDVTERKQAEAVLLIKTMLLEAQSETSIDGILAVDNKGRSMLFNKRFGELWTIPQHILDTKDDTKMLEYVLKQLKDPEEFGRKVAYLYEHRDEKSRDEIEFADGRYLDRYSSPLLSTDGQHLGRIWFFRDITERKLAEEELKQTLEKLRKSLIGTIQALSSTVETRDPYTAGHQRRVSNLARTIAQEMGLPKDTIDTIRTAGAIHDIGKISVPAEILSKPGRISDIEMSLIKVHSQSGYDILKDVGLPYPIAEVVLQHHERLDGSGYPQGLKGDQIFLEAQIISVADVVEAIYSFRPYRPGFGIDVALEEIEKNKGILYDKQVVEACLKLFREKGFKFEPT